MSFDDIIVDAVLPAQFSAFGVDATVQRGAAEPVPLRIIVKRNVPQFGEYGQVVSTVDTVRFQLEQWQPQQGDVLAWIDRLGAHSKSLAAEVESNGQSSKWVLHG